MSLANIRHPLSLQEVKGNKPRKWLYGLSALGWQGLLSLFQLIFKSRPLANSNPLFYVDQKKGVCVLESLVYLVTFVANVTSFSICIKLSFGLFTEDKTTLCVCAWLHNRLQKEKTAHERKKRGKIISLQHVSLVCS